MSNKFLITNQQTDLIKANLVVASISATNLLASTTLKTDSTKRIVSANITIGDIANLQPILDSVLTNPFNGTIQATDFKSDAVPSLNEMSVIVDSVQTLAQNNATNVGVLEQKTQHISSTNNRINLAKSTTTFGECLLLNVDPAETAVSLFIEGAGGLSGGRFFTDCPLDLTPVFGSLTGTASIHTKGGILCEKTMKTTNFICNTINGASPSGGMFMLANTCGVVTGTSEQSLFQGALGIGSLAIFANPGISAYKLSMSGLFSSTGNNCAIRVRFNGNVMMEMEIILTGSSNEHFSLIFDFTVREVGTPGQLATTAHLVYSDGPSTDYRGDVFTQINNTINTTVQNNIDVTMAYTSSILSNNIRVQQATLVRTF